MTDHKDDKAILEKMGFDFSNGSKSKAKRTKYEEGVIADFKLIEDFVHHHGRLPHMEEKRDYTEKELAIDLERLRQCEKSMSILQPLDKMGILESDHPDQKKESVQDISDDAAILAKMGIDITPQDEYIAELTELKHVRSSEMRRGQRLENEAGDRQPCQDFEIFKPLFNKVQKELDDKTRQTRQVSGNAKIEAGGFFILNGQKAYIAEKGEIFKNSSGHEDARLRIIFDNGTESNILLLSLQKSLWQDKNGRLLTDNNAGPLFSNDEIDQKDMASGTIYVLRSKSEEPSIKENRLNLHKIGVTSGSVERRITNARQDPTFLRADVEIIATYRLFNINRMGLEKLIHEVFHDARADIEIPDGFGGFNRPKEWFMVPLHVIDEAVNHIKNNTIRDMFYDRDQGELINITENNLQNIPTIG